MPELPEVETICRGLGQRLRNFRIHDIDVLHERTIASLGGPKLFRESLIGAWVGLWRRRGKYLIAQLENRCNSNFISECGLWVVHLRMTGQLLWYENANPICRHTRVCLRDINGREIHFVDVRSFGQMWWVPQEIEVESAITGLGSLGPEPFSDDFSIAYLVEQLQRSRRPIKTALLDQRLVAGPGNIYADESLFLAGIRPQTVCCKLSRERIIRLRLSLIDTLNRGIAAGGTTFSNFCNLEGINGNYSSQAWVYRRRGQPCRVCGNQICRTYLAGRSSHWCPNCQT